MVRVRNVLVSTIAAIALAGEARATGELVYPQDGRVRDIGYFGAPRVGRHTHQGLDIARALGTPVYAARGGRVTFSGRTDPYGYGTLVEIDHGSGYATWYGHMRTLLVVSGQTIAVGTQVGNVGVEGNARGTEPHCHFEVRRYGVPQLVPGAAYQSIARGSPIPRTYSGLTAIASAGATSGPLRAWLSQGGFVNVRSGPSTSSSIVGAIKTDRTCISHGTNAAGDWLAIDYKGHEAWVNRAVLTPLPARPVVRVKVAQTSFTNEKGSPVGIALSNQVYPVHGETPTRYEIDWGDFAYAYLAKASVWLGSSK